MKNREWKDAENNTYYLFQTENGLIVGQVHNITHTKVWIAKIPLSVHEEVHLGQYITTDFAKRAVENYWLTQERTLLEN
jgi:hypothetical protein